MYQVLLVKYKEKGNFFQNRFTHLHLRNCVACSPKLKHLFVQNTGSYTFLKLGLIPGEPDI